MYSSLILLQKNPPHELLIGTNLLSILGFHFIQESFSLEPVDLLTVKKTEDKGKIQAQGATSQNTLDQLLDTKLISAV